MSVDIHWETIISGADGIELAEQIRAFIHERFQQVQLPRFIRSVKVHSFNLGSIAPEVELKDICEPLPEFYEEQDDDGDESHGVLEDSNNTHAQNRDGLLSTATLKTRDRLHQLDRADTKDAATTIGNRPAMINTQHPSLRMNSAQFGHDGGFTPTIGITPTPGIPGGTANMSYFHMPFSGAATPLAAFAGAQFQNVGGDREQIPQSQHHHSASASSITPPSSIMDLPSRPVSQQLQQPFSPTFDARSESTSGADQEPQLLAHFRERSDDDVQVVFHVRYAGDVRLSLTAEILLDYPMPSFVGIPLKLNVTGITFDGVAILAYIRSRCHFCFLSPEDAEMLLGKGGSESGNEKGEDRKWQLGLLESIKVESEIGERGDGKQSLKNVGKVEKFVLEQVRRIFEDEFVYPSFWTFLV
ncbi:MAG: Mitochondrial distribution and morphology protein 12 [Bogoriella megaspora]|nr:MAG: Mitochondrial distribution and morphology protein 12 [Bogoriella megaspora]